MIFGYFLTSLFSTLVSYKLVPKIIRLGNKFSLIDKPSSRKQHLKPLVRIGGLAIIIAFFISFSICFLFLSSINPNLLQDEFLLIILCSIFCFFLMGFADED